MRSAQKNFLCRARQGHDMEIPTGRERPMRRLVGVNKFSPKKRNSKKTPMKSGIRDQVEGSAKDAKGAAKQKIGKAMGDPQKAAEGTLDRAKGHLQKKTGQLKRDVMRD